MPFVLAVLVISVGLSYARGGRLSRVADAPLRASWLLFVGVGIQVIVDIGVGRGVLPDAGLGGYLLLLLSQLLVLVWVALNWTLPGMVLVLAGLLLNALVMGANGAMPVDIEAVRALGFDDAEVPLGKHTVMTADTLLPWLADIWVLTPLRTVISVGDVVLAVGLIPLMHALMREDGRTAGHHGEVPVDGEA